MPKPPGLIDKVNAIVKFVENPCRAPWLVYMETALPAAGNLLLSLVSFGMDDVVRGWARPKGIRSSRHGRKGSKGRGGRGGGGGIPEIGEEIGKRLPGAEAAKGRHVSDGVKNLWFVDGVIQRGLWHWMVVDLTVDFFYDWSSLINESRFCSRGEAGGAMRMALPGTIGALSGWHALQCPILRYEYNGVQTTTATCQVDEGTWTFICSASGANIGQTIGVVDLAIGYAPDGSENISVSSSGSLLPTNSYSLCTSATVKGPALVIFLIRISAGFASITAADISAVQA